MNDDAGCLRRYAEARDENAFAEFVRRNIDFVYSAACRQTGGDVHLAQDIAQKVFVAAAQKAAALGRHPVVAAWLHQTTRYATIDAVRVRQRRQARELAAEPMTEIISESTESVDWERISPELDRIIASLGERDRNAVILRFFGGKSFADIGAQLHLSEGAARMRVERALEKLRVRLSRLGLTSSSAALGVILAEQGVLAAPVGLGAAVLAPALAAPAAGGLLATMGIFMTSTKITLGVATLVTLASITLAIREHRHALAAEQAAASAEHRPAPPRETAPAKPSPGQLAGDVPAANTAAPAGHPKNSFSALLELLDNPAMQKQSALQAQSRIDSQYAALFKALKLSPDQLEQFKKLLVEKQMVGFDSMAAAHQQGIDLNSNPKALFVVIAGAEKTVDTQIAEVLGADGFSQFQQYQATIPARNTANLLDVALSYTATPLSDAQTAGVIQILTAYGTPPLPPGNPFTVLNGDLGIVKLSDEGLAQLQATLSPPQLQALQAKMQQQFQLLQARERMAH